MTTPEVIRSLNWLEDSIWTTDMPFVRFCGLSLGNGTLFGRLGIQGQDTRVREKSLCTIWVPRIGYCRSTAGYFYTDIPRGHANSVTSVTACRPEGYYARLPGSSCYL
eukprot:1320684-Amorphochlora_amoeboformis.AAC.1